MLSTVEVKSVTQSQSYKIIRATLSHAREIVTCYESVFGKGGVRAPGHEAYPAPEVFSEQGVRAIVNDAAREFLIMEVDAEIAAGMIITHNSSFHREFGCVAVAKKFQGRGLSTLMLKEAKELERHQSLVVNVTEIVTHSILSQSAHKKAGNGCITGLGFCQ